MRNRNAPVLLVLATLLTLNHANPKALFADEPQYGTVEVSVTAGLEPLAGASVALDLNNNGIWDEHLGEPIQWTDGSGVAYFYDIVSIHNPGGGAADDPVDWRPTRIMMGNVRGAVGAPDVAIDFVLPAGSGQASLGLYDLRGRRIAQTSGTGDLALTLPSGLPFGAYFLRLSAEPAAPVAQRITSVGVRIRTIRATRLSPAEAVAAGWVGSSRTPAGEQKSRDDGHQITILVSHVEYGGMNQSVTIFPGQNSSVVEMPESPSGFVYIPPGTFTMGSPPSEPGRSEWDVPQHQVTLTQGFYMSRYEVTDHWWFQVMGGMPPTSQLPRAYVTWDMAVQFCNALSLQEGLIPAYTIHGLNGDVTWNQSANGYRLPTEAEWEYACRSGSTTAFANGPITHIYCSPLDSNLDAMGWYCGNYTPLGPKVVGQKQANAWGLYDMHGNLWEWVWCSWRTYTSSAQQDPVTSSGPGAVRLLRGGYWGDYARSCRSAYRRFSVPDYASFGIGFRPVKSAF